MKTPEEVIERAKEWAKELGQAKDPSGYSQENARELLQILEEAAPDEAKAVATVHWKMRLLEQTMLGVWGEEKANQMLVALKTPGFESAISFGEIQLLVRLLKRELEKGAIEEPTI